MIDPNTLKSLSSSLSAALKDGVLSNGFINDSKQELEQSIHILLQSHLRKLNVVSRDEFDAQTAVLQRTREKLSSLEASLQELEALLNDKK